MVSATAGKKCHFFIIEILHAHINLFDSSLSSKNLEENTGAVALGTF